jgi:hypothetical protein
VKEVVMHSDASMELEAAEEFYESRLEGLGLRFLLAVEGRIELMTAFPESASPADGGLRKASVPGFPFSIIYQDAQDVF